MRILRAISKVRWDKMGPLGFSAYCFTIRPGNEVGRMYVFRGNWRGKDWRKFHIHAGVRIRARGGARNAIIQFRGKGGTPQSCSLEKQPELCGCMKHEELLEH